MAYEDINIGDVVNIADIDWIVLDKRERAALCLTKDFIYERKIFDNRTNDYENSSIRRELNTNFLQRIIGAVGERSVLNAKIDLTSEDGLDDYGFVVDKVGLLTADMYRVYNRVIERHPINRWWWLATPWSTPHRVYDYSVCCVNVSGTLGCGNCCNDFGVRPFCIFSSSIF